jgi:GNAT superfamily N-acetyltransferase
VSTTSVTVARSDAEIAACHPVMSQLRPHVAAEEFVPRVRRQMGQGYELAYLSAEGRPVAVAGFRVLEYLFSGVTLYVDDLVTDSNARSKGYGEQLMQWLVEHARQRGCVSLQLDSGVQRFDAHRFYLALRMRISSHHFALDLTPGPK